jgi:hypothetical protein
MYTHAHMAWQSLNFFVVGREVALRDDELIVLKKK